MLVERMHSEFVPKTISALLPLKVSFTGGLNIFLSPWWGCRFHTWFTNWVSLCV